MSRAPVAASNSRRRWLGDLAVLIGAGLAVAGLGLVGLCASEVLTGRYGGDRAMRFRALPPLMIGIVVIPAGGLLWWLGLRAVRGML
jgi:hypothetical protein